MALKRFYSAANKEITERSFSQVEFVVGKVDRVKNFFLLELLEVGDSELSGKEVRSVIKGVWSPDDSSLAEQLSIGVSVTITGMVVVSPTQGFTVMISDLAVTGGHLHDEVNSEFTSSGHLRPDVDYLKTKRVVVVSADGGELHDSIDMVEDLLISLGYSLQFIPFNYRKESEDDLSSLISSLDKVDNDDIVYFDLVGASLSDSLVLNKKSIISSLSNLPAPLIVSPNSPPYFSIITELASSKLQLADVMLGLSRALTVHMEGCSSRCGDLPSPRELSSNISQIVNEIADALINNNASDNTSWSAVPQEESCPLSLSVVAEIKQLLVSTLDREGAVIHSEPCALPTLSLGFVGDIGRALSDVLFDSLINEQAKPANYTNRHDLGAVVDGIKLSICQELVANAMATPDAGGATVTDMKRQRIAVEDLVKGDEVYITVSHSEGEVRSVVIENLKNK